jgi:two-component system sensor histidine kinase KdpD
VIGQIDFSRALRDIAERLLHEMRLVGVAIEIENFDGTVTDVTAGEVGSNPYLQSATGNRRHLSPTSLVQGSPTAGELSKSQLAPAYAPSDSFLKNVAPTLHIVPILAQNRSAGRMLLVQYQDSTDFSATDSRLLLAVAGQIGLAVERNYLRKEAADSEIWRRSDTMKDAMLNAVSHDLRTPLASILASAGTLRQSQSDADGEEATQLAGAIEEEARRLDHLVGSLLDLSRIRGGALRPLKAWRDFGTLVDDVLGRLKPLMVNHTLVVEIPDEMPPAYLDHVEIYQVLSNLIENAIKYTPAGGQIDIAVRCNDEYVEVEISDRGPGIPVSDLPFVFEPFYRGPGTGPRPQGSGLGLAVAKGFVEAHGGRIWAENRPSGGAKVSFTLPLFQDVDIGNTDREPR